MASSNTFWRPSSNSRNPGHKHEVTSVSLQTGTVQDSLLSELLEGGGEIGMHTQCEEAHQIALLIVARAGTYSK